MRLTADPPLCQKTEGTRRSPVRAPATTAVIPAGTGPRAVRRGPAATTHGVHGTTAPAHAVASAPARTRDHDPRQAVAAARR